MKKQILFILTGLMLAVGAGAVIYETTGTDLQVWIQNTIVYSAKVSDIDSISTQETANAKKIRMWVNQAMAYEADVRGIDSITFAKYIEPVIPSDTIPTDTIPADTVHYEWARLPFTVGEEKHVYFSPGNLQYQASAGTWRFAEHQYDYIGAGNANIAEFYGGWIDLFDWNTGTHPALADSGHLWRALSKDEWEYMLYTRPGHDNLYCFAIVNGVSGLVLLPDEWVLPEGVSMTTNTAQWTKNNYSPLQWSVMESAGAVFLPAAGWRNGTEVLNLNDFGKYWSSTRSDTEGEAMYLELFVAIGPGNIAQVHTASDAMEYGFSVRAVEPIEPDIPIDTIPADTIPVIPPDTIPAIDCPEGAIPGLFSVAADKRVYFSRGNLQYVDSIWQFAEHQWDYFGTDQSDGHRDLFGWGTGFLPNMVSTTGSDYWAFVDWGENAISNGGNKENLWQTLTQPEFTYLFFTRENADSLFGFGTVNGTNGMIILPDNWTLPAGATFVVSTPQDLVDYGCTYTYSSSNKFSQNTYTAEQWAVMERAGAVFLPTAGYRSNKTNVLYVGSRGYYWSATPQINSNSSNSNANCMYFSTQYLKSANTSYRNYGRSVRLVQPEILPDTVKKNIIRHEFSVAESKEVYFSPGNLQYRASTDTWRFAEHQYDTIGAANANISDTYDGWIDLFGWGTGDKPTMSIQDHEYYFYCYHDWGMNHISYPGDTIDHQWRALTSEEWTYLYNKRPNCTHLSGYGKINGVPGYIILPDDWKPREGLEFVGRANSATNTYSLEQWERMEALGAIFLPHAGMRDGTEVSTGKGRYWFSSIEMTFEGCARSLETTNEVGIKNATYTWYGYSVRLIEPVVPEVAPPDPEPIAHPEGAVAGLFSVSETKKVYFSQGNLQYNAGVWRFAEHQYDTIGADNQYILSTNMGWIDLFGWGTGDRPRETSTNTSDYLDSYVDWGVNPISNAGNTPNMWYTMTKDEWEYVFNGRPNAIELRGNGIVNGVAGYIFLPDDWQLPYGGRFFPNRGRYLSNVYNLEEWARMEAAGAVFLPNAGKRRGTEVSIGGGEYWSSTRIEAYRTVGYFLVGVSEQAGATVISSTPDYAKSVRMVQPETLPVDTIPADTIPAIDCPEGAIPGLFSVAADKRVYFSRGNLQYVDSIWRFAEHQWDYFGKSQSDNYRDLFGWGTGLEPNKVSSDASSYTFFTDWGGNPIANGGNKGFLWETMSQQEFMYLFLYREKADSLIGFGTVNGINGLIILPDEWVLPAGAVFNPGVTMGLVAETYQYNNSNKNNFSHNTYTAEQWAVMERAGAAFLPTAGYRSSSSASGVGTSGEYWTSTPASDSYPNYAYHTDLDKQYLKFATFNNRNYGRSVRLVQPEVLDTAHQRIRGKFSVAEGKQVYIAPGNLQYRASTDTWRFAEHQYDTIGAGNANIADDYDGWIDLFGWGTGDKPTMRTSINDYYYYSYHDWGMNPISYPGDTIEHHWRALTYDEWNYLYNERPDYKKLSGHAIIDGIKGFIFLPDDWKLPWGLTFYARTSTWSKNTYTLEQWEKMEDAGAVFLPAAGHRTVAKVSYVNRYGDYWFSSLRTDLEMHSQGFEFYENGDAFSGYKTQIKTSTYAASEGIAVRLVEPVEPEVAPEEPEPIPHPEGAIAGLFSVSETKKVYFSKGNLQYSACGWQFAEHQWDTIGADNANIETELGAPIDLFGWGTGDRPYLTSTNTGDYIDSYVGWGVNPIINGGNTPRMWATMTSAEWEYLFDGRPNAGKLRGHGCVNGVNGYIFLPDDWQLPYGARFFPNRGQWLGNVYTLEEWAPMERAGAVFLPAAGRRSGTAVSDVNKSGNYWSSSKNEEFSLAGHYYFSWVQNLSNPNYLISENQIQRVVSVYPDVAFSVRLVRPQADSIPGDTLPADTVPAVEPEVVKGFTCNSSGRQLVFAKGNLQYQGNSNTWRFAEHPWDTCGHDNAYMSPVTRKWVDLPGYMRADLPALTSSDNSYYTRAASYSFVKVPISNGGGYKWWVPGANEYEYIIDKRPNHAQLFSGATVNGIAGLVILPDEWVLPAGLSFVSAEAAGLKDKGNYYSGVANIYALNTYSTEEWMRMDAAGAVFLPAAGYRHEYTISGVQEWGYYWTSAVDGTDETKTFSFEFIQSQVTLMHKVPKTSGYAVRMIRYLNDTIRHNPTAPEPKPASVTFTARADSTQLLFAPGNLQFRDGHYYFADHQYDTLGTINTTAGLVTTENYYGPYAMDLFGWGTATNPLLMSSESDDYQTFTNWGTMPIMNTTETWRTPGIDEYRYILRYRNYADKLFAGATVNGIAGLIILPDHFVVPDGIEFHSSTDPDMGYVKYDKGYRGARLYSHNTYTLAEWAQMEAAGAVFLPAAGFRAGSGDNVRLHSVNEEGYYWTNAIRLNSSGAVNNPAVAYDLIFTATSMIPEAEDFRTYGRSVRLVRTVAP